MGSDGLYLVSVCLSVTGRTEGHTCTLCNRRNKSHTNKLEAKNWKMREGSLEFTAGRTVAWGSLVPTSANRQVSLSLAFVLFGKSFCLKTRNSII